jgi:hypothetical protein
MTTRSNGYETIMTPRSRLTAIYPLLTYTAVNIPAGKPPPKSHKKVKKLTVTQLIKLCHYADMGEQLKTSSGMSRRVK